MGKIVQTFFFLTGITNLYLRGNNQKWPKKYRFNEKIKFFGIACGKKIIIITDDKAVSLKFNLLSFNLSLFFVMLLEYFLFLLPSEGFSLSNYFHDYTEINKPNN